MYYVEHKGIKHQIEKIQLQYQQQQSITGIIRKAKGIITMKNTRRKKVEKQVQGKKNPEK